MAQRIAQISLVVKDYDEALDFYINKLDFQLLEDTKLSEEKRWVVIAPKGSKGCSVLLAKASNAEQLSSVGNQTGGRVSFFLFTDDFWGDYELMKEKEFFFIRPPEELSYGIVTVFKDLYGNLWDFIQPSKENKGKLEQ